MNGFFITGTDTEIGKTLVTALLTLGLNQQNYHYLPIKPIASGAVEHDGVLVSEDAIIYKKIANVDYPYSVLNPFCLKKAASPHLAAELEQQNIDLKPIIDHINYFSQNNVLLIEGIGGWRVPISRNYFVNDFAKELNLPVILVCANRLGAINHTLLTAERIMADGLVLHGIVMTHKEPVQDNIIAKDNIQTILNTLRIPLLGNIPFLEESFFAATTLEKWHVIKPFFDWNLFDLNVE